MKNWTESLLACALIAGATLPLSAANSNCECDGGTTALSVDCDGDGVKDACSTNDCPAPSVAITAGGGDVRKDCEMLWNSSVSGGSGSYTFLWTATTGSFTASKQSVKALAGILGAGTMTVTVTDGLSGKTGSDTVGYHVREELELTTNSESEKKEGNPINVGDGYTCPATSDGCKYTFSATKTKSHNWGLTIGAEGKVLILAKAKLEASYSFTSTSSQGHSLEVSMNPGVTYAMYAIPRYTDVAGTFKRYDCSGELESGSWSIEKAAEPDFRYEPLVVN